MVNEKLAENRKRYEQKRVIKKVSFNAETEKSFWNMPKISIFPNGLNQS
ncbi:putative phage associated protein [Neisseria gonorrhoeae]|uniref:Putative phage associated protein n=1 Tax=Neisseria gonorrhoeae TaxID=485 RepID=A0A378VXP7_NEIGO|nr:putative phage associated protein [Neisseria gonorrhoeae]